MAGNSGDNFTTSCASTASTGITTCNGDGDGNINPNNYEKFRFWQHLTSAGMIEGQFTGMRGSSGAYDHDIGSNQPSGRINNTGWYSYDLATSFGDGIIFTLNYNKALGIGAAMSGNSYSSGPFLRPEEAWNIDSKIDDGKPGTGKAIVMYWDDCTDGATTTSLSANYLLNNTAIACSMVFNNAF